MVTYSDISLLIMTLSNQLAEAAELSFRPCGWAFNLLELVQQDSPPIAIWESASTLMLK